MQLEPTPLSGLHVVRLSPRIDERGHATRTFDRGALAERGLPGGIAETTVSFHRALGTLRAPNWQPNEARALHVLRGSVFVAVVDLRTGSPTLGRWTGLGLDTLHPTTLYVPPGCAAGYLTLAEDTELQVHASVPHDRTQRRRLRWDDPSVGIHWPIHPRMMSRRDADAAMAA